MNRIDTLFAEARAAGRTAFMPFLTAGDPDLPTTAALIRGIAQQASAAGVPVLFELGFPYSDPIADGAAIQASYVRALAGKVKQAAIFDMVADLRRDVVAPLVAMASVSLLTRAGIAAWFAQAKAAGLDGAIVPDLPAEEAAEVRAAATASGLKLIQLVAPTTPPERVERILDTTDGFVYMVSVVGITGERAALPADLGDRLAKLRTQTKLPICVGFGVSNPEHVAALAGLADGAIVGSALVKRLADCGTPAGRTALLEFAAALLKPLAR